MLIREGVIRMPKELVFGSLLSQHQFYTCANETLDELLTAEEEIENLKEQIRQLKEKLSTTVV